jgi:hypothetical protein
MGAEEATTVAAVDSEPIALKQKKPVDLPT